MRKYNAEFYQIKWTVYSMQEKTDAHSEKD